MRKITIRKSDRIIETEVSEEELRELLGLNSTNLEQSDSNTVIYPNVSPSVENRQKRKGVQHLNLISETKGEVKGRGTQSQFQVYRSIFNKLIGIVQSENHRYRYNLGKLNDEQSIVSIIASSIDDIHSNTFSKKDLRNKLPAKFTNGHTEKLCLDYFEKMGYIERIRDKASVYGDIIVYRKIRPIKQNKKSDDSGAILVSQPSESSVVSTQNT